MSCQFPSFVIFLKCIWLCIGLYNENKILSVWFGRDCGWRWEREKDHGEEGREGWGKTTSGAIASEGKKSGSSISEILQGLGPCSSSGEVGWWCRCVSDSGLQLPFCLCTLSKGLWKSENPRVVPLKAPFLHACKSPVVRRGYLVPAVAGLLCFQGEGIREREGSNWM